jgi:hypothetical protein
MLNLRLPKKFSKRYRFAAGNQPLNPNIRSDKAGYADG